MLIWQSVAVHREAGRSSPSAGITAMASIDMSSPRGSFTLAGAERAGGGSGMRDDTSHGVDSGHPGAEHQAVRDDRLAVRAECGRRLIARYCMPGHGRAPLAFSRSAGIHRRASITTSIVRWPRLGRRCTGPGADRDQPASPGPGYSVRPDIPGQRSWHAVRGRASLEQPGRERPLETGNGRLDQPGSLAGGHTAAGTVPSG